MSIEDNRLKQLKEDLDKLDLVPKEEIHRNLYLDLKSLYEQLVDRRKTISSQAQNITGFTGIIQTIVIGLIVALVTNNDAVSLLKDISGLEYLKLLLIIGFISYIITILLALIAFWEGRIYIVPQLGGSTTLRKYQDRISVYLNDPKIYDLETAIIQYGESIDNLLEENKKRRKILFFSLTFLFIGIIATLGGGFFILAPQMLPTDFDAIGVWIPLCVGLIIGLGVGLLIGLFYVTISAIKK
jgi:hypothetical protein